MSVAPNGSLGDYEVAPSAGSSPATYYPVAVANNQTLVDTYEVNHVALGSAFNAGYHTIITLASTVAPAANSFWQLFSDGSNVFLQPPTSTGLAQQLNASAPIALAYGNYWQISTTIGSLPVTLTYSTPLGNTLTNVTITLTYPTTTVSNSTILVQYQNPSGANILMAPIYSFGIGILASNGGGGAYANAVGWTTSSVPGTVSSGVGAYTNGVVMQIGKSFTTTSTVTVSASVTTNGNFTVVP